MEKKLSVIVVLLFTTCLLTAAPGDTTLIRTFTFDEGRQPAWEYKKGTFLFPSGDISYEKIVMLYTLKCDESLTPACGEWDYIVTTVLKEHTGIFEEGIEIIRDWQLAEYITPYGYGISLDDGWTWIYDVSDFVHLLKDSVEIWDLNFQEKIDIRFLFIEGTPPREVIGMESVWAGRYRLQNFDELIRDTTLLLPDGAKQVKLRATLTGHDFDNPTQCAEFCPNIHRVMANGQEVDRWQIREECGDNPLYPQGGTWVYDRAGWCPGTKATTREVDLTPYIRNNSITFDYDIEFDSNGYYFTHIELVFYGEPDFDDDVRAEEILAPTTNPLYGRNNPTCAHPVVVIRNTGKNFLTSAAIHYTIGGDETYRYQWEGALRFLETDTVRLPVPDWQSAPLNDGKGRFSFSVSEPNGQQDPTPWNNTLRSEFTLPVISHTGQLTVYFNTNHMAGETTWEISNLYGDILYGNPDTLLPNTFYETYMTLGDGCYKLHLRDTAHDGLKFWFNMPPYGNGTAGYAQIRQQGASGISHPLLHAVNPDFGKEYVFYFGVNRYTGVRENLFADNRLKIYPVPASDVLYIEAAAFLRPDIDVEIYDIFGRLVIRETTNIRPRGEIGISALTPGIYLLIGRDKKQELGRAKFVVSGK